MSEGPRRRQDIFCMLGAPIDDAGWCLTMVCGFDSIAIIERSMDGWMDEVEWNSVVDDVLDNVLDELLIEWASGSFCVLMSGSFCEVDSIRLRLAWLDFA